eukprot:1641098-Prorocentrum_lima.AAC.1
MAKATGNSKTEEEVETMTNLIEILIMTTNTETPDVEMGDNTAFTELMSQNRELHSAIRTQQGNMVNMGTAIN